MNFAVEKKVFLLSAEHRQQAGLVKYISVEEVLIYALTAFISALLVILPYFAIF